MLLADQFPPEAWEAICTPMHEILPEGVKSAGSGALWLGSWTASVDSELLSRNKIKAIVECHDSPWGVCESVSLPASPTPPSFARSPTSPHYQPGSRPPLARASSTVTGGSNSSAGSIKKADGISRFRVSISDSSTPDLLKPHLDGVVRFIDEKISRGENVLVHCQQGISRSAAIVVAYLMRTYNMNYDSAHAAVKAKRKCIKPNSGFERTLRESWQ